MESHLVFNGIEKLLLMRFPELRPLVEKELWYYDLWSETPDPYPLWRVLREFLFDLLDLGGDDPLLPRIFAFFEEMAESPDTDVTDLLGIEILERLVSQPERVRRAWKYMGSKTKELARETAQYRGQLGNLPLDESGCGDAP